MAIVSFDALAVIAVLPSIGAQLGDVERLPWVITGFLFTSLGGVIIGGPAIDGWGARRTFRAAIVLFVVTSLGCALSSSLGMLIGLRVVQGVGGGLFLAVALSTIGLAYPPELRPRIVAANSGVWALSALVAPSAAAILVATTGWRGVFVAVTALALLAGLFGWRHLPKAGEASARVTFSGFSFALTMMFAGASLAALSKLTWTSLLWLSVAGIVAVIYWQYARRGHETVLSTRHLVRMPFAAINVAAAICFGAAVGLNSYLPLYVQGALGLAAHVAASSVIALALGWTSGAVAANLLDRQVGTASLPVVGATFVAGSLMSGGLVFTSERMLSAVVTVFFVCGVGVGLTSVSLLTLLHAQAERDQIGRATSVFQFVRTLSHMYGTALFGAVVLFSIIYQVGEADMVRQLLEGEQSPTAAATEDAIAAGFRISAALAGGLGLLAVIAAARLKRYLGSDERRGGLIDGHAHE